MGQAIRESPAVLSSASLAELQNLLILQSAEPSWLGPQGIPVGCQNARTVSSGNGGSGQLGACESLGSGLIGEGSRDDTIDGLV